MRFLSLIVIVFLLMACAASKGPLDGITLPEPEEFHLFHPFIQGVGYVKHTQMDKLQDARKDLERVIAEDATLQYPEAYPYLVECYRLLGITDSATWIYPNAQAKLAVLPRVAPELVANINGWAGFYPELPDSFKLKDFKVMDAGVEPLGGLMAFYRQLEYPEMAKNMNRTGITYLIFVVKADGSLSGLQVLVSSYPDLDEAALDAVKNIQWIPARYHGHPVPFQMVFPVYFGR